jgi:hypothetical protein
VILFELDLDLLSCIDFLLSLLNFLEERVIEGLFDREAEVGVKHQDATQKVDGISSCSWVESIKVEARSRREGR